MIWNINGEIIDTEGRIQDKLRDIEKANEPTIDSVRNERKDGWKSHPPSGAELEEELIKLYEINKELLLKKLLETHEELLYELRKKFR